MTASTAIWQRITGLVLCANLAGCGGGHAAMLAALPAESAGVIPAASRLQPLADARTAAPTVTVAAGELPPLARAPFVVPDAPRKLAADPLTGNEAVLSVSPAETLPAVEDFIKSARHTLWIEMFEFGGTYGKKLVPLILERAHAGVSVKLLLDQVGSSSAKKGIKPFAKDLAAAGVQVVFYPVGWRDDHHGGRRINITHRKLLLADGDVAMEGGTNLGTDFDTTEQDLMVRWRGPVVGDLYHEFGIEWNFVGGGPLPIPLGPFPPAGDVDGRVLVTSTPEGRFEIRDEVFKHIDAAQREIIIEQQYLWADDLVSHLLAALARGVKVRCIIPGGTAEKFTLWALNMNAVHRLVEAGAEARGFYNPDAPEAHLHTKFFAVDGNWVSAGSANGDERSFEDHQELDVVTTQPAFVQEMCDRVFEADWANQSKPYVYQPGTPVQRPLEGLLGLLDYYF